MQLTKDSTSPRQDFVLHPLALLAVSFALGICVSHFFILSIKVYLPECLLCSAGAGGCLVGRRWRLASWFIVLAFFGAGAMMESLEQRSAASNRLQRLYEDGVVASGEPVEITGVMIGPQESGPEGFFVTLRVESVRFKEAEHEISGMVRLAAHVRDDSERLEYESMNLRHGARLRLMTRLERAEGFRNPGVSSFTEYLERQGFDASGVIKSPLLMERLDDEPVFLPLAWIYEWRQRLLAEIEKRFSAEAAGVLDAALLGNRYHLSHGVAERFREGGTFHVLVISGLHVSFIGGLILLLVRQLTRRRAWQFAISVLFLWAYTLAVGAESSVVRASLMFSVMTLAPVLHRRAMSLNALGGAGLLLLLWQPGNLFDPSFQLTFLSVLMIITIAWPLLQKLEEVGSWRLTSETPYPPACPRWWRQLGEVLFWREMEWRREMARSLYSYRLFKHPWARRLERLHLQPILRYAFGAVLISASVQLGLLPLLVLYFHRLSLASIFLNIFVGALMAALSLVALAALLLSQLSTALAVPFLWLAEFFNWLMVHSVDPFARAHMASLRLPHYTGPVSLVYILYYLPYLVLSLSLARWRPLSGRINERKGNFHAPVRVLSTLSFIILLALIVFHPLSAGRPDGRLHLDFLDVGQGDAALITMPDGTTLLIDGGGRPNFNRQRKDDPDAYEEAESFEPDTRSIGEAVVSEYLWWRGLDHVDYILATHADMDHINGLNDVARNFKVRAALVARSPLSNPEYYKFAKTMQQSEVPVHLLSRGDLFSFGDVRADVLWPPPAKNAEAPSNNNDSIVLRLRFGQRVFLLLGDLEKEGEAALIAAQDEPGCDVIKVGHHGSKTSSTEAFVTVTHPSIAVISVGLSSPFGHPNKEVVGRWLAHGAQVLTTGQQGTISISTDGSDLKLKTFVNGR